MAEVEKRYVETGLTGKKNKEILDSVMGQLSDGMWENSPMMESYWRFMDIELKDNKVLIAIDQISSKFNSYNHTWKYNKMLRQPDYYVKAWFAEKIKHIVKEEMKYYKDLGMWKRINTNELGYMGYDEKITVADAYNAYDILKGRKVEVTA